MIKSTPVFALAKAIVLMFVTDTLSLTNLYSSCAAAVTASVAAVQLTPICVAEIPENEDNEPTEGATVSEVPVPDVFVSADPVSVELFLQCKNESAKMIAMNRA